MSAPVVSVIAAADVVAEGALRIKDAVEWSGVGRSQLYAAMARGELPFVKVGKRRLIPKSALRNFLAVRVEGWLGDGGGPVSGSVGDDTT